MATKQSVKYFFVFAAGFVAAGLLAVFLFLTQPAEAISYPCMETPLKRSASSSRWDGAIYQIYYEIPSCVAEEGFKLIAARHYKANEIEVNFGR